MFKAKLFAGVFFIFTFFVGNGVVAQLSSEAVSEGPCMTNLTEYLADVDPVWLFTPRNYYAPIASEGCYRNYAEVILGRPAQDQEELSKMQARIAFASGTALPTLYTYGYVGEEAPGSFIQECPLPESSPKDVSFLKCFPTSGTDGTDLSAMAQTEDGVVWTDHQTSILIVRCVNELRRDWKLLTVGPTVTDEVKAIVTEKVVSMGFNETLISTMAYT